MKLAEFILNNVGAIAAEWEDFAVTLVPAARDMTLLALRDHIEPILNAIAKDIVTAQTGLEQTEKSKGRAPGIAGAPETAAETHAILRARSGFDINQMVAEYRALRASVLRLWLKDSAPAEAELEEMIRFNEAIDQAVAESVLEFNAHVEQSRNLLLGMLGHDMRSPLGTITATASYLAALNAGEQVTTAAARLIRSGKSLQVLLDELVDFNRTTFGLGVNVVPVEVDLNAVVADELEQLRGAHPGKQLDLVASGDLLGRWDAGRLQQIIRNLVTNALRYGAPDRPVAVRLRADEANVWMEVSNVGQVVDLSDTGRFFHPLARGPEQGGNSVQSSLGLGLFIVREIAKAHGGDVAFHSEGTVNTFVVRLPRHKNGR